VLCTLAEQSMTKETWVDLWRFEIKQFVWTIEHIFPQGENIPPSWVSMIAGWRRDQGERSSARSMFTNWELDYLRIQQCLGQQEL